MRHRFDSAIALLGLVLTLPIFLIAATAIKLDDGGPVFYRQLRVGQQGRAFRIWKFRTMANSPPPSAPLTVGGDPRITRIGRLLRRTKVDELPQLINVLLGDMVLVGPRPEVPCFVQQYSDAQRQVLRLKPGITDPASLAYIDEETVLRRAANPVAYYYEHIMPKKIDINIDYQERANFISDIKILFLTLARLGQKIRIKNVQQ